MLQPFSIAGLTFENLYRDFAGHYFVHALLYDSTGAPVPEYIRDAPEVDGRPDHVQHAMIFSWPGLRITRPCVYQIQVTLGKRRYTDRGVEHYMVGKARTGPITTLDNDQTTNASSETCSTCIESSQTYSTSYQSSEMYDSDDQSSEAYTVDG